MTLKTDPHQTIMFQCTNLAVQWDHTVEGTCWSNNTIQALSYTNVACNITTDILLAIVIPVSITQTLERAFPSHLIMRSHLPFQMPMLWQVQLNRRQKSSVIGILGLGIFATAAAIVKISFLPNYGRTGDWLWDSRDITIWTVLETCVGIIAGNLPCLKPLFPTVLGSTYGRGSKGRTGGTGTTPRYLSKAYGVGTNAHSAKANGFTSLTSSKAGRPPHDPYEMTAMGFGEGESRAMSAASNREDGRSEKSSQGSVELLGTQGANLKLGGILKTTEVTQSHEDTRVASPLPRTAEQDIRPEKSVRNLV